VINDAAKKELVKDSEDDYSEEQNENGSGSYEEDDDYMDGASDKDVKRQAFKVDDRSTPE
jgi:hypothetical protein